MPGASAGLFDALIALDNQIVNNGETLRLACCETALTDDETEALARIERAFEEGGLTVPSVKEVLGESGVEEKRARTLLQILLKRKALVRVNEDLVYHPAALEELRSLLAGHDGERFSVPMFKEWTGVSRKYAIPLLEFLDRSKITKREGDERVVM
jgi:selenocysteine-specific elongation factor